MSALIRRVRRSPFARDLRDFAAVFTVGALFFAVLLTGVHLGMAVDDLAVIVDPATGLATVVEVNR